MKGSPVACRSFYTSQEPFKLLLNELSPAKWGSQPLQVRKYSGCGLATFCSWVWLGEDRAGGHACSEFTH